MRIVIFGTGEIFKTYIKTIKSSVEIVGIIDNDASKIGTEIEGVCVRRPEKINEMTYDAVFLFSNYSPAMRKQLRKLNVNERKIYDLDQIAKFFDCVETEYLGEIRKTEQKRIVVFSIALNSTGANNAMYLLIKVLKNNGYDVTVVAHLGGEILNKLKELDVTVVLTNAFSFDNAAFAEIVELSDIVIVNTLWMYQLVYELLDNGYNLIWWIHETSGLDTMSSKYIQDLLVCSDCRVWFVSNTVKKLYEEYCDSVLESEIVQFGIEEKTVPSASFVGDKVSFACIGHIGWGKGQDIFIKAAYMLPEEIKSKSEFFIVGAGKLDGESEKLVERSSNIHVSGEVSYDNMDKIYDSIDAVACCSREEGMSSVVVEASMYKRLSLITDIAGIVEFVDNKRNAIVFKSETPSELSEKMIWVITHLVESKQIAEESFSIYKNHFSMGSFEKRVLELVNIL